MDVYAGKKILILGGAYQHCKLVEAAKSLGIVTYVVDYLPIEKAPAKQIADYHLEYNLTEYDRIISLCREEHIDGVLSAYFDAPQIPYQRICEELSLPCFGTREQFRILTNKRFFKQKCEEYGIDIIHEYDESDFLDENTCKVHFPVFVKPCDSRGSRGQTVCKEYSEVRDAIDFAKRESQSGEIIIEVYMGEKFDFAVTYLVIDGKPVLLRTSDRYLGTVADKMDRSSVCTISPSRFTDMYLKNVDEKVKDLICGLGIKNGPVFMQGFIDKETVRFYDPGLRCPGGEFDRQYENITGIGIARELVKFALSGELQIDPILIKENLGLKNKVTAILFLVLRPGKIKKILGLEEIRKNPAVVSAFWRVNVGDVIGDRYDTTQRLGEVDIVSDNLDDFKAAIDFVYRTVSVLDDNDNEMIFSKIDCNRLSTS